MSRITSRITETVQIAYDIAGLPDQSQTCCWVGYVLFVSVYRLSGSQHWS